MQSRGNGTPERNNSHISTSSHRPGAGRTRSRKQSLVTSVPNSAKSLVSFPSLSPDNSPGPGGHGKISTNPFTQSEQTTPRKPSTHGPSIVEALIRSTPSFRGRSALFGDSPKGNTKNVPGALHLASDEHLEYQINKTGAVNLVRQLAEDLAERDVEMTNLRRRAEERERELKRMLQEVEVSNQDIEIRLHLISNAYGESGLGIQDLVLKADAKNSAISDRIVSVTNGIDEMMGEAMEDDVGFSKMDETYLDSLDERDGHAHATIRAGAVGLGDGRSTHSSADSQSRSRNTVKGWKDYLWNGNVLSGKTSRASSMMSDHNDDEGITRVRGASSTNPRRKGLNDDLFQPLQRSLTMQSTQSENHSRKSSTSVASWTMKLFAGNPHAGRDSEIQSTVRGRSATTGNGTNKTLRTTSTASGPPQSSAKAALLKVNGMNTNPRTFRKNVAPLNLGSNEVVKSASQPPTGSQAPTSPNNLNESTNLGPVEMDMILPVDSRPPTLMQSNSNHPNDLLIDRFGFIYDQRRRKREADAHTTMVNHRKLNGGVEMLSGSRDHKKTNSVNESPETRSLQRPETPASTDDRVGEKPTKRWQDYLKVATFPTELLSHTPSTKPITNVISTDTPSPLKRSPTFGDARGSLPSNSLNPEPLASTITASNAEISKPSASASASQPTYSTGEAEPVKILLAQLTELHDALQRERTIKWNEFLRKVRAERKKEGESAAADVRSKQAVMPEVTLADGEMIGVAGLGNKGKVGRAKWLEFKQLVLAGIPVAYRAKIWAECSGASALRVPGYYDDLISSDIDDPVILAQIQMDINRTLTDNVFFRKGPGVTKLNEVLLAYSRRNPEVGYCQGMNLITASLLLIMPAAEDAFWVLTSIIENILPRHYYDHSLLASRADQQVLRQYVAEILPKLSTHLDKLGIELEALTFQWFLSIFTDCLSAEALFRVWDVVLCFNDGSTFLFQVALALLKLNEGQLLECGTAAEIYGYIGHEMTDHAISIDGLVNASEGLRNVVRRGEVEERRKRAIDGERDRGTGSTSHSASADERELRLEEPMPIEGE